VQFFPEQERQTFFWNLLGGGAFHYGFDLFQLHITPFYMPLFPFSQRFFEIGCVGTETTLYFIPLFLAMALLVRRTTKPVKEEKSPKENQ
jgi:hypothetical protein